MQDPLLPPTVTDQIRLWESEKHRLQASDGFLYDDFRAAADFKLVRDYAQQLGVIVWEADPSLPPPTCWRFFVNEQGHGPIRSVFFRLYKLRSALICICDYSDFIRRRTQAAG